MSGIEQQSASETAAQATESARPGTAGQNSDTSRARDESRTEGRRRDRNRGADRGRREQAHPFAGLPAELVEALEMVSQAFNSQRMTSQQKMDQLTQMGIVPVHIFNGQTRTYTFPATDSGFRVAIRAIGRSILRIESFKRGILSGNVIVSDNALGIVKDLGRSDDDETRIPMIILPLVEAAQGISSRVDTAMGEMYSFRDRARSRTSSSQAAVPEAEPAAGSTVEEQPAAPAGEPAADFLQSFGEGTVESGFVPDPPQTDEGSPNEPEAAQEGEGTPEDADGGNDAEKEPTTKRGRRSVLGA